MLLGGFLSIFLLGGCAGGTTDVHLTVGAEGFEPPLVKVDAGKAIELEVENDTRTVQTVTVQGRPGLRVRPGQTFSRELEALDAGDHRVTLSGAPFQATIRVK
jgi:plastocyanin